MPIHSMCLWLCEFPHAEMKIAVFLQLECELNQRKILEISTTDNKRIFGDTQKMGNKLFLSFIKVGFSFKEK